MATSAAAVSARLRRAGFDTIPRTQRFGVRVTSHNQGAVLVNVEAPAGETYTLAERVRRELRTWDGYTVGGGYGLFTITKP